MTPFMRMFFLIVLGLGLASSCKQAEFAGNGAKRPADKPVEDPPDTSVPLGNPDDPPAIEDPVEEDPILVGDDEDEDTPPPDEVDTDSDSDGPNWLDIIGGLVKILKDVEIDETEDGITFGGRKKFHIGDGQAANSTCQGGLATHPLSGTKFFFEFEVLEDGTKADIEVESICGVDYADLNKVYVENKSGGNRQGEETLAVGASDHNLQSMTLNKGTYLVVVESIPNPASNNDADDFVVGKVRIMGDKPMKAGKVGAN